MGRDKGDKGVRSRNDATTVTAVAVKRTATIAISVEVAG